MQDEELLDNFQRKAFDFFLHSANPENGLVPDTSREDAPASIACVGFALSAYPVAVERGWMTRGEAINRTLATLRFFRDAPQNEQSDSTGYKGFYYHFLDMKSGRRVRECELSVIDTGLLLAGILTASCYFSRAVDAENDIREIAETLCERVDWHWAQNGGKGLSQGWKPESGFLLRDWAGYNEAAILFFLGLGSCAHPLGAESYREWTKTYQWKNMYGHECLYAGPLFIHHFSHAWVDFREIRDAFMQERNFDYFKNSRHATYIQQRYGEVNPHRFLGYGTHCWGLSACDGPDVPVQNRDGVKQKGYAYEARGAPYGPDDGTIAPACVLASVPFAPEIAIPAIRHMMETYPDVMVDYRVHGGFNPSAKIIDGSPWVSDGVYGLDQGSIVLMIENHRSQMIWNLMRTSSALRTGLLKAGFTGGWLQN